MARLSRVLSIHGGGIVVSGSRAVHALAMATCHAAVDLEDLGEAG